MQQFNSQERKSQHKMVTEVIIGIARVMEVKEVGLNDCLGVLRILVELNLLPSADSKSSFFFLRNVCVST